MHELESPAELRERIPLSARAAATITSARNEIRRIMFGETSRSLIVVAGVVQLGDALPQRSLVELSQRYSRAALVLYLVSSAEGIHKGSSRLNSFRNLFERQRRLLLELSEVNIPAGAVLEDTVSPQYFADLLSWGMIPLWATESQIHRELASGVSFPVSFCASDPVGLKLAADAVETARCRHHFVGMSKRGQVAMVTTSGNSDCSVFISRKDEASSRLVTSEVMQYLDARGITSRVLVSLAAIETDKVSTELIYIDTIGLASGTQSRLAALETQLATLYSSDPS